MHNYSLAVKPHLGGLTVPHVAACVTAFIIELLCLVHATHRQSSCSGEHAFDRQTIMFDRLFRTEAARCADDSAKELLLVDFFFH